MANDGKARAGVIIWFLRVATPAAFGYWIYHLTPGERIHAAGYAIAGLLLIEVNLTAVTRIWREHSWKLEGFTSLWAAPLYMSAASLFEPLYHYLYPESGPHAIWILRGVIYTACIYIAEPSYLAYLKRVYGVIPWLYTGEGALLGGKIQTAYAPLWFAASLGGEYLSDFLGTHASCFLH